MSVVVTLFTLVVLLCTFGSCKWQAQDLFKFMNGEHICLSIESRGDNICVKPSLFPGPSYPVYQGTTLRPPYPTRLGSTSSYRPPQDERTMDEIISEVKGYIQSESQGILLAVCCCMLSILLVMVIMMTIVLVKLRSLQSPKTHVIMEAHRYSNLGTDRHNADHTPYTVLVPGTNLTRGGTLLRGQSSNESHSYMEIVTDDNIGTGSADTNRNRPTNSKHVHNKPQVSPKGGNGSRKVSVNGYLTPVSEEATSETAIVKKTHGQSSGKGLGVLFLKRS